MIPRHYVAMHRLHDHGVNKVAISSSSTDAALKSLYTPEELNQPLQQTPQARSGHLLLSCPQRRSIILHGGLSNGPLGLMNDTWEFLVDYHRWVRLICRGEPRKELNSSEYATLQSERNTTHSSIFRDDYYDDNDSDDAEASVAGGLMPPRAFGQCGVLYGEGRFLFVHGGVTTLGRTTSDAFRLDIERRSWARIPLLQPMPSMWGSAAQVVRLPVKALVAAGQISTTGNSCEEEEQEGRVVEVVVLFGGMHQANAFNDTYFLYLTQPPPSEGRTSYKEGEGRVVVKLPPVPKKIFPGRRRACSVVCNNYFLFIFGGRDENYFYNDMWILNTLTRQWVMVRGEVPQLYMQEFFRFPCRTAPGIRIMGLVEEILRFRRKAVGTDGKDNPHKSRRYNSSAYWRTGATMVNYGTEVFVFGGFTMDQFGYIITHRDVHAYDYVHHVWREVEVEEGRSLPPFPPGYFRSSCLAGEEPQPQWELLRGIPSMFSEGRTMAAMCRDPIRPSLRFFMFGGRMEDDPCGDLFDVRIRVEFQGPPPAKDQMLERQRQLARLYFTTPQARAPWEMSPWGRRSLLLQLLDWTRAVVTEGEALNAIQNMRPRTSREVPPLHKECAAHATEVESTLRNKLSILPKVVNEQVLLPQPFVLPEELRG
ncbi:Galactose oxidase, central domain/Kelch motif containing protein, putative [Trypanosoma equiperdum]|nr:Galactose oxidase, central domain/Kelch motif containing protein, putative [Trypanosoma equiperdum]